MRRMPIVVALALCILALCSFAFYQTQVSATESAGASAGAASKPLTLDLGKGIAMDLALVPAGKFTMGSPEAQADRQLDECPPHDVTISKPFYVGVYEVTQEQYEALTGANPSHFQGAKNPVEQVSWDEAVEFCKKLSAKTGKTVRLPTEAQWEYACRAGTKTRFGVCDKDADLNEYGWSAANSECKTHPVGQKKPNAWGLYDMHGNVEEWCSDWYAETYAGAGASDPQGPATGQSRVLRGGCWDFVPSGCRSAFRQFFYTPGYRNGKYGFRVVVESN